MKPSAVPAPSAPFTSRRDLSDRLLWVFLRASQTTDDERECYLQEHELILKQLQEIDRRNSSPA